MKEILPGVFHWTTFHEGIQSTVHSYYVEAAEPAVLIDPRVPDEGLPWFESHDHPAHALLTNRHHYRHSGRFAKVYDTKVWCHRAGLHEFQKGEKVRPFDHGDTLPGGFEAVEIGSLCPEETALYLPSRKLVALGDSLVRDEDGRLAFVPDFLMGENPEEVKHGLVAAFRRLLDRDFDTMLMAHGAPWVGGAHDALEAFLEKQG